jgi:hypothetical protein
MEVKTQEQFVSASMTNEELEELVTRFANEFPNKTILRTCSPCSMYGKESFTVRSLMLKTMGHAGGWVGDSGPQITDMQIEEIRNEIRKNDVFILYQIKALPMAASDGIFYDIMWKVRYAALKNPEIVEEGKDYFRV